MRGSRYLLAAGAVVAVLAIALIVGLQLRDRNTVVAAPSASPTPSTTSLPNVNPSANPTATSSPSASPAGGAIYNDDFGFIVTDYGGFTADVRTESGSQRQGLQGLSFNSQGFAASADGKYVAYWTLSTSSRPSELRMFTTLGNATEQTLVTLVSGQRGGGIAWSSDGAGLLYSTETGSFGVGGGTNSATLNMYELAANGRHGTTIDTETNHGILYRPIAWDRSANLAVVGGTGEGGFMGFYFTVRFNADNSFKVDRVDSASRGMSMGSIRASTDAKFVLGVGGGTGSDIMFWPIDNYGAIKTGSTTGRRGAAWRPGTHEIGFMSADQFWLGDVDKFGPQGLCCTAFSGAPATSAVGVFRADGTAVVLNVPLGAGGPPPAGPPSANQTQYILVRLGSDPKATSGDRVTFQELRSLAVSVRFR